MSIEEQEKIYRKRLSKNIRQKLNPPKPGKHEKSKLQKGVELQNNHNQLRKLQALRQKCKKWIENKKAQQNQQNKIDAKQHTTPQQRKENSTKMKNQDTEHNRRIC